MRKFFSTVQWLTEHQLLKLKSTLLTFVYGLLRNSVCTGDTAANLSRPWLRAWTVVRDIVHIHRQRA